MEYVNLGSSGLKVSRICLGMMTYGSPKWRPWVLDRAASRPFIKRAIEAGINFFDTANLYSNGLSEVLTGKLLKESSSPRKFISMFLTILRQMRLPPMHRPFRRTPAVCPENISSPLWMHR